jgi:hypothetical protein
VVFAVVVWAVAVFAGTLAVVVDDPDEVLVSAAITAPVPTKVATAEVATHLRMVRFRRRRAVRRMAAFWCGSVGALMETSDLEGRLPCTTIAGVCPESVRVR